MKKQQKPTRAQKKLLASYGKKSEDWLVERDTPEKTVFVNRDGTTTFIIPKG